MDFKEKQDLRQQQIQVERHTVGRHTNETKSKLAGYGMGEGKRSVTDSKRYKIKLAVMQWFKERNGVADAPPEITESPQASMQISKKSWKKKAQEETMNSTHVSEKDKEYDQVALADDNIMSEKERQTIASKNLTEILKEMSNSFDEEVKALCTTGNVDGRALRAFFHGHKTNGNGEPLNEEEKIKKELDKTFAREYCSNDLKRRIPYLEKFTKEMMELKFTEEMFDSENVCKNAGVINRIGNKMTYFENVFKDPINRPYFSQLPEYQKRMLDATWGLLTGPVGVLFTNRMMCLGIDPNSGEIMSELGDSITETAKSMADEYLHHFRQYGEQSEKTLRLAEEERKREERREQNKREALQLEEERLRDSHVSLTRQEAISSYSDYLQGESRFDLEGLNVKLKQAGEEELFNIIQNYVSHNRYEVGYTQETKNLKMAMEAVKNTLNMRKNIPAEVRETLEVIQDYFEKLTKGDLKIPFNAEILDKSGENPTDSGYKKRGRRRNALITKASYWSDQRNTPLFSHEPSINDLKQRLVSNCYMVAATAGLVHMDPRILKKCMVDNGDGTVTVRLYKGITVENEEGKVKKDGSQDNGGSGADNQENESLDDMVILEDVPPTVMVPVYIRVSKETPKIMGADALSSGALWMQMIEKAAAFHGRDGVLGYRSLWYGKGGEFLKYLLGIIPDSKKLIDIKNDKEETEKLFRDICNSRQDGIIYNTGTRKDVKAKDGLNAGHAYTIMGGKEVDGQKYILLRNPYGTHSLVYEEDGTKKRTGTALTLKSDETYGQFYVKYEDFLEKFEDIDITNLKKLPQEL